MKLLNTLSRVKEEFAPHAKSRVTLYACGPTVYDFAHIGHFRAYIFVDVLRRALLFYGYPLTHVMNITDVGHLTDDADQGEDKMETKAESEKKTVWDIAQMYTDDLFSAMEKLNVERPDIVCKATDHISEMIALIKKIEAHGCAYRITDGIYFDTSKVADYGKLAKLDIQELREGARVEPNPEKRNPTDFALWKFSPTPSRRQMEWSSPWGVGYPGWHIECTAMAVKYLGEAIDIHTGGIDHIPIHHTNEIAQAWGAFGHDIVRYWLHNEFVLVDGSKMSKSLKNFYTMQDILLRGYDPLAVRYLFLQAHYRTPVNFTWNSLEAAQNALQNVRTKMRTLIDHAPRSTTAASANPKSAQYLHDFTESIADDLNTSTAMAHMWDLLKDDEIDAKEKLAALHRFDAVLGLSLRTIEPIHDQPLPEHLKALMREREKARSERNYEAADKLRVLIENEGYVIEDTSDGQSIKPRNTRGPN